MPFWSDWAAIGSHVTQSFAQSSQWLLVLEELKGVRTALARNSRSPHGARCRPVHRVQPYGPPRSFGRVAPGNFTPRRSQIPDVNLSIHPARATAVKAAAFRQDQSSSSGCPLT